MPKRHIPGAVSFSPEVSLDFHAGAMIDPVQEGFDLAIMPASPLDSTLIRRILAKWHYLFCCSPVYLETHSTPRRPAAGSRVRDQAVPRDDRTYVSCSHCSA
jgi:DNA-binding transcriptional LysR family regulator